MHLLLRRSSRRHGWVAPQKVASCRAEDFRGSGKSLGPTVLLLWYHHGLSAMRCLCGEAPQLATPRYGLPVPGWQLTDSLAGRLHWPSTTIQRLMLCCDPHGHDCRLAASIPMQEGHTMSHHLRLKRAMCCLWDPRHCWKWPRYSFDRTYSTRLGRCPQHRLEIPSAIRRYWSHPHQGIQWPLKICSEDQLWLLLRMDNLSSWLPTNFEWMA